MDRTSIMFLQAIAYLVERDSMGIPDEVTLYKLLYFADRYHLRMYGSTVTRDKYVAMKMGQALWAKSPFACTTCGVCG